MMKNEDLLRNIHGPQDVKSIPEENLEAFCAQIRQRLVDTVSKTGGHLSSNLGIVELTVALLRVFDPGVDRVVWDVGHQCYVYKMLTGRLDKMDTIRKKDGIAGFPNPRESVFDTFVVGHSSTAVSAANGMAKAKKICEQDGYTVAVVGDGALTGGLAYEGLSNAGRSNDKLIVILNDNQMSISPNVGFAARHLSNLRTRPRYIKFKNGVAHFFKHIPLCGNFLYRLVLSSKNSMKRAVYKDVSFFEDMGFYYLGPINGHDIGQVSRALETARLLARPVVIHAETVKGKGYAFAERDPGAYHGVGCFTPDQPLAPVATKNFSTVFGETLTELAAEDPHIVGITAAMLRGTGLKFFADRHPKRCFDTGIAEGHAVTFASGLATAGVTPVFAVYSTFLQRAYDQLLNDTALMNNHIVLAVDRAGIVPEEGETHQGIFDVAFLTTIPHTTIYAPATYAELRLHLKQAIYDVDGIAAVRYPRGEETPALRDYVPTYDAYTLQEVEDAETLVITYGTLYADVLAAAQMACEAGKPVSILKLGRIFPVETACVQMAMGYKRVIFAEEGIRRGGLGEYFAAQLAENGFKGTYRICAIDKPLPPCTVAQGKEMCGLDKDSLFACLTALEVENE